MSLHDRLRALEQTAEAASITVAALRQQITALVSEAEHGEQVARATEAVQPAPMFYGGFGDDRPDTAPLKVEKSHDASTKQKPASRRP
jgi:hypothetical protein